MASWDLAEAGLCPGWVPHGPSTLPGTVHPGQRVRSHLPYQPGHYEALGSQSLGCTHRSCTKLRSAEQPYPCLCLFPCWPHPHL